MPWNSQGGGGWQGGGGPGPWGGRPGGGQQPPDLEELLRRSQEKVRSLFPGGGGGGGGLGRKGFVLVGLVIVGPLARQRHLHRGTRRAGPGAALRPPRPGDRARPEVPPAAPIESVEKVPVTRVNRIEVGFRSAQHDRRCAARARATSTTRR